MPSDPAPADAPNSPQFGEVLHRNIHTLAEIRRKAQERKGLQDRIADVITKFTGSMAFVYVHLAWFGGWVIAHLGRVGIRPFDPFPFALLTMIGSLEAIFLSTFVLISQNRMITDADKRAELDLQISLLAEHEITQVLTLLDGIAKQLGVIRGEDPKVEESKRDVDPAAVFQEIESREGEDESY